MKRSERRNQWSWKEFIKFEIKAEALYYGVKSAVLFLFRKV